MIANLKFLGAGSRRECYEIPGEGLCLKCYRDPSTAPNKTVATEIFKTRYDEEKNTCAQEYRYYEDLKLKLPAELFAVFPEKVELVYDEKRGYALKESIVRNHDGSECKSFCLYYHRSDRSTKEKLLEEFKKLILGLATYAVRFYDTQNILVQTVSDGSFRLRIVDFEPAARTLFPIDSLCPAISRMKVIRRAKRYLKCHCGATVDFHS